MAFDLWTALISRYTFFHLSDIIISDNRFRPTVVNYSYRKQRYVKYSFLNYRKQIWYIKCTEIRLLYPNRNGVIYLRVILLNRLLPNNT